MVGDGQKETEAGTVGTLRTPRRPTAKISTAITTTTNGGDHYNYDGWSLTHDKRRRRATFSKRDTG